LKYKKGLIAGCFDVIHPGYIKMFQDAKKVCRHLTIALHSDPTIDRPEKNKPVQTISERKFILQSIKYVDEIVTYDTEKDLYSLLNLLELDVRILGTDYKNKSFTGDDLKIPIHFHERDHEWSSTDLKTRIKNSLE
jgi:glycerol-3-phosphate cytidylyltransferase